MQKTMSLASARAPWLRVVGQSESAPVALPATPDTATAISSKTKRHISPNGAGQSYAIRVLAWPQADGAWALGVLKECWAYGAFLQGDPSDFMLWQCPQPFADRAAVEDVVRFYDVNKTIPMVLHELLAERGATVVAQCYDRQIQSALPFDRNAMVVVGAGVQKLRHSHA